MLTLMIVDASVRKKKKAENDVFWASSSFPQADHPGSPIFYSAVHLFIRSSSMMTHMSEDMLSRLEELPCDNAEDGKRIEV